MGVKVHVVDATIRSNSDDFESKSTRSAGDVVVSIGAACNGIIQAVNDARRATRTHSVDAVIFYGHGASGIQSVSMGKDGRRVNEEGAAITLKTLDDAGFREALRALRPRFSKGGHHSARLPYRRRR